ncbi:hypothetical protein [Micromonospora sp. CPCC 205739]|uniref:hypothetical protein n=1 Tax=unclassified Micromonospora TaxID=2617518 RepID=UPI003FA58339
MDAFVSQLPALLGVVVGALGTGPATFLSARSQWKRGQAVRLDERRLEAYSEFAQVLKEIQAVSLKVLATAADDKYRSGLDKAAALPRLAYADIRHTLVWENLLLLGDATTVAAAQDWREAVWRLEHRARGVGETSERRIGRSIRPSSATRRFLLREQQRRVRAGGGRRRSPRTRAVVEVREGL